MLLSPPHDTEYGVNIKTLLMLNRKHRATGTFKLSLAKRYGEENYSTIQNLQQTSTFKDQNNYFKYEIDLGKQSAVSPL